MVWGRWYKILIWFYINAVQVWCDSKTQIAPWFLDEPFDSLEEFAKFIQMFDDCENGIVDKKFCSTTSFFVVDENDRLVGATSLRHYPTYLGFQTWGHIGYGCPPKREKEGLCHQDAAAYA